MDFHFHALCEQNVDALEGALVNFEKKFSPIFFKIKMGKVLEEDIILLEADYDVDGLIKLFEKILKLNIHT